MTETTTPAFSTSEDQHLQLYNPTPAALWSILLTPVFGAAIIWFNWLTLGDRKAQRRSLFWLLGLTVLFALLELTDWIPYNTYIQIAVLVAWFFLECRPQAKHLKFLKFSKLDWLPPLSIGIPVYYAVLIISIVLTIFTGAPMLIPTNASAYERSSKDIVQYLDKTRMEPLRQKVAAGEILTSKDNLEIRAYNYVVNMLRRRNMEDAGITPGANELMDYAMEKLNGGLK